jgi:hypothetical protein
VVVGCSGDQNTAWRAGLFQSGRHVDAVPQEVLAIDQYVAEIDSDTQDNPALIRDLRLPFRQLLLDYSRAGNSLDDGTELGDQAVAGQLDDAAVVFRQQGLEQGLTQICDRGES